MSASIDELDDFMDRYAAAKEAESKLVNENGAKPTKQFPVPRELLPGYEHPAYDPTKPGKVCMVCEKQKPAKKFGRNFYMQGGYANICVVCVAEFERIDQAGGNSKARQRRLEKEVRAQARELAKTSRKRARESTTDPEHLVSRELAQRKLAKDHLLPFIQRFNDKYEAGWVHRAICKRLERFSREVAAKNAPRLMIFMPPRAGKSEIASKTFPAWHLGHYPDHEIIASSYAVSLPMGFSRKIKDIVATPSYRAVFKETKLNPNAQAAEAWLTTKGGGYVAAGVGSGITGKGAHIGVIDDPVKDAEEADSETQREKVWDWYSSTFYTRLAPGGGILVIQTRWHDDDLSGRLIRQQKELEIELTERMEQIREELEATQSAPLKAQLEAELAKTEHEFENREIWDIMVFPQVATHDEYYSPRTDEFSSEAGPGKGWARIRRKDEVLHAQRFNERMVTRMRQTMQPRHWSALHQQNPIPDEGDIFTKSMFRYEPTVPDWRVWDIYIAGDLALGKKQHNDWSVLLVGAMDFESNLHIIEMSRFKGGADPITENLLALLRRYEKQLVRFGLEEGQIQMAIWPEIERRIIHEKLHVSVASGRHALKPISDKPARSRVAQAMMQQGRIIWPENQPWVEDARTELLRFPGGINDDIVDALAWLARMTVKAPAPQPKRRKKIKSWKDKVNEAYRHQLGASSGGYMGT